MSINYIFFNDWASFNLLPYVFVVKTINLHNKTRMKTSISIQAQKFKNGQTDKGRYRADVQRL